MYYYTPNASFVNRKNKGMARAILQNFEKNVDKCICPCYTKQVLRGMV